ncbi:hypothetical protein JCM19037_3087 [Geomicrobium sp. JCM 19037]|uniref:hypothetical protein n=1 Tax=Geomicrobium sp. JCM 19037 TaxID=1460634 RepID=UPI00045F3B85|nr:hypothetical protein [Geomicrobium sp. JCM 19037]GAK04646.1 hypothetical protein JCM19037_3087 [Geomicrobium sp. JCM 19037]
MLSYCVLKFTSLPIVVRHRKGWGTKTYAEGLKIATELITWHKHVMAGHVCDNPALKPGTFGAQLSQIARFVTVDTIYVHIHV